ncbi:MAG: hypothetical protein NTY98_08650 [Verrucomicrobia bacterium]|nr:hypothetical protein [Verrucomicrobiota bacterium]
MPAPVLGDCLFVGELGNPERPGDIATRIGHAPQGHAKGPPEEAVPKEETQDAGGKEDVQHRTHSEEVKAVINQPPGIRKDDAGQHRHHPGDPSDIEFAQVDAVAWVREVFNEQACCGEVADAHHHPGDEQRAEIAVLSHPAHGAPEAGAGIFRCFPRGDWQAIGPEA